MHFEALFHFCQLAFASCGGGIYNGQEIEALQQRLSELEAEVMENQKTTAFDFCALGMKSHKIPKSSIYSSSRYGKHYGKKWARLDQQPIEGTSSGSWCANTGDPYKWINVDLGTTMEVGGIVTQGSPSSDFWTTSYMVSCGSSDGIFKYVEEFGEVKLFKANSDRNSKAINFFREKITCRYVRVHPKAWKGGACMRMDILRGTCSYPQKYKIYVESAGFDDGNNCKVMINGVDRTRKGRGHCVVIFDPRTKAINASAFDTYYTTTYPQQSNAMVNFINAAPTYSIVSIAVMDSSLAGFVTDEASDLLESLGAVGTSCQTKIARRDSWAFVSQKVRPGEPRPSFTSCQHVLHYGGRAAVHASILTSAHYDDLESSPIG